MKAPTGTRLEETQQLFTAVGDVIREVIPADYAGSPTDYAALKKAGVAVLGWGQFITVLINFVILAFIIFLLIRAANKVMRKPEEVVAPTEIELLSEIRDELKRRP